MRDVIVPVAWMSVDLTAVRLLQIWAELAIDSEYWGFPY